MTETFLSDDEAQLGGKGRVSRMKLETGSQAGAEAADKL